MTLSAQAESLLNAMARDQGLKKLAFDKDGLIPIKLGPDLEIAIAFSTANNSFYLMGVLDVRGAEGAGPWRAFEHNRMLTERRTRIAVEPNSGALVLVRDIYLMGLEYWQFSEALDRFVRDVEDMRMSIKDAMSAEGLSDQADAMSWTTDDLVIFRP